MEKNTYDDRLNESESLQLIARMINKAQDAYRDTGITAIMWGIVIAVSAIVKLAEIHFDFELPFDIFLLTFAALIPQVIITIREKKARKVKGYDDIYLDSIWLAFGVSIGMLVLIVNVVFANWGPVAIEYNKLTGHASPFRFSEYVSAFFLMLYAIPTFITGFACKFRPMIIGGIVCWVSCIISLFTEVRIDMLLTAISAITAWLIPGIILERDYRKAKKQEALLNV